MDGPCAGARHDWRQSMADVIYVLVTLASFAAIWGFGRLAERL